MYACMQSARKSGRSQCVKGVYTAMGGGRGSALAGEEKTVERKWGTGKVGFQAKFHLASCSLPRSSEASSLNALGERSKDMAFVQPGTKRDGRGAENQRHGKDTRKIVRRTSTQVADGDLDGLALPLDLDLLAADWCKETNASSVVRFVTLGL